VRARRSLAALVKRPWLRRLFLAPVQLTYRIARMGRRDPELEQPQSAPEIFALHFGYANREHMREQIQPDEPDVLVPEP